MLKHVFAAALSLAVAGAFVPPPAHAQDATRAPSAKPAAKPAASAGRTAARERQKQCGAEWKEAKAAGTVQKGQTWPKFWSACNKRLKEKTT
jgi:hypothetical protein